LTDGEQGADVVLGHHLHERVLHHLKAVQDVGWNHRNVARSAQPALVADPHDDLAADDSEHLVTEMGVHWTAAVVGGAGARSPPSAAADHRNVQQRRENRHCRGTRRT